MEGLLKEKVGKSFSWRYFLLTLFLTIFVSVSIVLFTQLYSNIFIQFITRASIIFYIWLSFFVSIMHFSNNKILRPINWMIRKVLPINEARIKAGPVSILRYLYMVALGLALLLIFYAFMQWFIPTLFPLGAGFFTFIWTSGSIMPILIFGLIIICPSIFCGLFLWSSLTHNDVRKQRYAPFVIFLPVLFFLPTTSLFLYHLINIIFALFGSAMAAGMLGTPLEYFFAIFSGNIISSFYGFLTGFIRFFLFLIPWTITLLLWYGKGTKRTVLVCFSIGFTQALASLFVFYNSLIQQLVGGINLVFTFLVEPIH
ncbi:MAG: hypothetical protein ACTSRW_17015, partial [Candidatus Helarchaeota archaeon]